MNSKVVDKNKKVKLGVCQWSLPSQDGTLEATSELGLDGISLLFEGDWKNNSLSNSKTQNAYMKSAEKLNIEFPAIGVNALCAVGMSKKEDQENVKEIYKKVIDIALAMNIKIIQVPSFGAGSINTEGELLQTIENLKYGCNIASKHGIIIGTENALSAEENLKILKQVDYSNLKIYFDTQNPHVVNHYQVPEMVDVLHPYICQIHAKDGKNGIMGNTLVGKGDASFYETIEKFKKYNYSGWVILETSYDSLASVKEDVRTLKELFR